MSPLSDYQLLEKSCLEAPLFPKNLVRQSTPPQHLDLYYKRLNDQSERLFCEDGQAALDILEYDDHVKDFQHTCAESLFTLKGRLEGGRHSIDDPRCRFLFVTAPHARAHLKISCKMLVAALTHHQVIPSFLDFIFPFGMQEYLQDFHFSGLREETRLSAPPAGLVLPKWGRSGREIRLCYNLKSVEASTSNPEWPWSIRQTALYHSFDVETGKAFWIMVKGNPQIKTRIQAATAKESFGSPDLKSLESTSKAFASTLATHLVLCHWCDEEWRWYLNYLEKRLQDATGRALAIIIDKEPSIYENLVHHHVEPHSTNSILKTVSNYTKQTFSTKSKRTKSNSGLETMMYQAPFPIPASPTSVSPPQGPPPPPPTIPPGMPGAVANEQRSEEEDFTFRNLQLVQHLEEKANEVPPVLEANIDILTELKEHYQVIFKSDDCPYELREDCQKEFTQFERRITSIITDLQRQRSRTQILRSLLGNRKGLLYEILNKRAIETSRVLAKKAQFSTERMEVMTDSMYEIAKKTQEETVSMKIITLVTLFFLPGTFISTIMSTDIVQFSDNTENFQLGALKMYLAITIPFMVLTFAAWYGMYLWTKKKEEDRQNRGRQESCESSIV